MHCPDGEYLAGLHPERLDFSDVYAASGHRIFFPMQTDWTMENTGLLRQLLLLSLLLLWLIMLLWLVRLLWRLLLLSLLLLWLILLLWLVRLLRRLLLLSLPLPRWFLGRPLLQTWW